MFVALMMYDDQLASTTDHTGGAGKLDTISCSDINCLPDDASHPSKNTDSMGVELILSWLVMLLHLLVITFLKVTK